ASRLESPAVDSSFVCDFIDGPGSTTVSVSANDGDTSVSDSHGVTVNNVAPTATLANDGPINEGSSATITFSDQADVSSVDTAAGFHYAYSCSNGSLASATYALASTSATTPCPFNDNGSYIVRARILDKDDG